MTHVDEREITAPVSLTLPDGRLNRDAVGWTRTPLITTDGIGQGRVGKWRNKRWEYWAVTTPTHIVALVASDIDYAGVHGVYCYDRVNDVAIAHDVLDPFARATTMPGTLGTGPVRVITKNLTIEIDEVDSGTHLRARGPRVDVDVVAHLPDGHERLGVVVPWSDTRFQYTVKDVARPATGTLTVDGIAHAVTDGWATLDHGRGRWPYSMHWNWGAGSGRVGDRVIGIQVGGKWTDGTGSTENSLVVDGHLTKISEELTWTYDLKAPMDQWRVSGDGVDLGFTPFHLRKANTQAVILSSHTYQVFGTWTGTVHNDAGETIPIDGLTGWAEDVRQRW